MNHSSFRLPPSSLREPLSFVPVPQPRKGDKPMAYNQFDVPAQTVSYATGLKTALGIFASTNICVKAMEGMFSFDGSTSTATPAQCEWDQITFATNPPGTNSTTVTPAKSDTGRAETIQATCGKTWTVQPTVITTQWPVAVAQYNGIYHYVNPFVSPFIIIGGKGGGLSINSSATVNFSGKLHAEE